MPVLKTSRSERQYGVVAMNFLVVLAGFIGASDAVAQSAGPDEMVNAAGAVSAPLVLTETQKTVIYNAVLRHHARGAAEIPGTVPAAVGAAVSPATELAELPDQAALVNPVGDMPATELKYAMVEGAVIVVDPVKMRVVDVIHGNARP